jgi:hypothetical protein
MKKKKSKLKVPAGYDSRLEYELHKNELKDWEYHPKEKVHYEVPSTYEADFRTETCSVGGVGCTQRGCGGKHQEILLEVKGRFRTREEASKYIHIREALRQQEKETDLKGSSSAPEREIIFLFQDSSKPMPFVKKRKDGTKQSHGEWAEKNGFKYECLRKGLTNKWLS